MRMNYRDKLISVIIPCWNGAAYIAEAVESVLQQGVRTEILVIDDASTDSSRETVARLACTLVSIPRSGIAKACNVGMAHAKGDYLMTLDQDDVLCEGSLRALLEAFLQDDTLQAVAAKAQDFLSPDLAPGDRKKILPRATPYHGLMTGAVLLRRDVLDIVGVFDESFRAGQAVDYLLRLEQSGINWKRLDLIWIKTNNS
jgi:glycosyltransferase involved in cell wall biosynthesis